MAPSVCGPNAVFHSCLRIAMQPMAIGTKSSKVANVNLCGFPGGTWSPIFTRRSKGVHQFPDKGGEHYIDRGRMAKVESARDHHWCLHYLHLNCVHSVVHQKTSRARRHFGFRVRHDVFQPAIDDVDRLLGSHDVRTRPAVAREFRHVGQCIVNTKRFKSHDFSCFHKFAVNHNVGQHINPFVFEPIALCHSLTWVRAPRLLRGPRWPTRILIR